MVACFVCLSLSLSAGIGACVYEAATTGSENHNVCLYIQVAWLSDLKTLPRFVGIFLQSLLAFSVRLHAVREGGCIYGCEHAAEELNHYAVCRFLC